VAQATWHFALQLLLLLGPIEQLPFVLLQFVKIRISEVIVVGHTCTARGLPRGCAFDVEQLLLLLLLVLIGR
jgi:hypothetical protein